MSYLFPLANMANAFAMTVLLIGLGLTGNTTLAAEVGIVQGATLALFYAFSANARSLILSKSSTVSASAVMAVRMSLLGPLAVASYWLSVSATAVPPILAIILILRRVIEWLSEVHLSEMERLDNRPFAIEYLITQSVLLMLAFGWLVADFRFPYLGLAVWALFPLVLSFKFISSGFANFSSMTKALLLNMLPHLGSTAIIGIGVYVFRLLILLLVGKETAGDLYTAFAIGGLTGSVFANSLGASIALHEQRSGKRHFPMLVKLPLNLSLIMGMLIFVGASLHLPVLNWTGKTYFFWQATGLSLVGGVVMVYAQRIRFRLLQQDEYRDVYGPDVMMNILLITSIPFVYYLFNIQAMAALYLLSAVLALIFYKSYQWAESRSSEHQLHIIKSKPLIAALILFPLFVQLGSGVFRDTAIHFNSGAMLHLLPIPVSVIACFGGILIIAAYRHAKIALSYIFFTCLLMVVTTIAVSQDINVQQQAKFILLVQFILPMFGLVLGQMYHSKIQQSTFDIEKAFLSVLLLIVPLQLLATWLQGYPYLSPYLYVFSIYQHLQYVPVIFVSAFLISVCTLWAVPEYKKPLLLLTPLMGIYVAASLSTLAVWLLLVGLVGFVVHQSRRLLDKTAMVLILMAALATGGYLQYRQDSADERLAFQSMNTQNQIVLDTKQRQYYAENIVTNAKTFLLGHATIPNRNDYPSAHNYYLDFIYSFGFIALLPMLLVLVYTLTLIYRSRANIFSSTSLLALASIVLFLIAIDNALKVGFRQPYSGIFIFFLWGVLISKLNQNFSKVNKDV